MVTRVILQRNRDIKPPCRRDSGDVVPPLVGVKHEGQLAERISRGRP